MSRNVIFIGLPGCGKTTVSRRVAEALGRPWYDSDLEIEKAEGMSISDIFVQRGEEYFRCLETRCVERLTAMESCVIAVGGGAVERNEALIKKGSKVIYLRRSIESILTTLETGTRPLLRNRDSLYALYERRSGIYERLCDVEIDNDSGMDDTIKKILEALA